MVSTKSPIEQAREDVQFFKFQKALVLTRLEVHTLKLRKLEMFQDPNWELAEVVKVQEAIDKLLETVARIRNLATQNGVKLTEEHPS